MIINTYKPVVESSEDFQASTFSVGDLGMIFDILRNKLYSNPIAAICREISCNARDTMRAVGRADEPIHIHLPNSLEPFYTVKDFGEGISPDRMEHVFIKYAASTKRDDNIQLGAYGIGAKTPFSYTSSFNIITVFKGQKYHYCAFIDETKVGKMALMSSEATTDPNGTEIIVPVKTVDFGAFVRETANSTNHWNLKPKFFGGNVNYDQATTLLSGENWKVVENDRSNGSYYASKEIKIILDGIQYTLDNSFFKSCPSPKIIDQLSSSLYLYFGIGDISLSANRETIYFDKATQNKIFEKIKFAIENIKIKAAEEISKCKSLMDAYTYAHLNLKPISSVPSFFVPLTWKNIPVSISSHIELNEKYNGQNKVFSYTKGLYRTRYGSVNKNKDKIKISRSFGRDLYLKNNSLIIVNDFDIEPSGRHIKKLFDSDKTLELVQVICPEDIKNIDAFMTKFHLKELGAKMLSEMMEAPKQPKAPSARVLTFLYNAHTSTFQQVPYSNYDEDKKLKILCSLTPETRYSSRKVLIKDHEGNTKEISSTIINAVLSINKDISIYGVDESISKDRLDKDFGDSIKIYDYIMSICKNPATDFRKIKWCKDNIIHIDRTVYNRFSSIKDQMTNSSIFWLYFNSAKLVIDSFENESRLLDIYEYCIGKLTDKDTDSWIVSNPKFDVLKFKIKFFQKYGLLNHIEKYKYDVAMLEITKYINLIDSLEK